MKRMVVCADGTWNLRDQLGTGSYDPRLERDLHSAAGELAEVVGWLAYDAEAHDLCRRMNQESLYFTRLAGDKTVELLTLQNSSMHAAAEGRPREALHRIGHAAVQQTAPGSA